MVKELEVANKVTVQLMNTDPDVRPRERIVKKTRKKLVYMMRWTSAPSGWIARCKKMLNHGQRSAPVHTRGKTKQGGMAIGQAALFFSLILTR